jgi:hypothetical protein
MKKLILVWIIGVANIGHSYESNTYIASPGVDSKFALKTVNSIYHVITDWLGANIGLSPQSADLEQLLGPKISDEEKELNLQLASNLQESQVFVCPPKGTAVSEKLPNLVKKYGVQDFCKNRDAILQKLGIGLFATALKLPEATVQKMVDVEVLKTVQDFAKKSRNYDPGISDADVFQASRNVWTAACLQKLLGTKIELNSSIYGYSMLYPYTDNVFDDPSLDGAAKKLFMKKFGMMLLGKQVEDLSSAEKKVYDMVQNMYLQYPPEQYPNIHQAILAIYYAQIASLEQRSPKVSGADVLFISGFKGSTSVLADAFFAKPDLSDAEIEMAIGFGFLLQLIDDLQDMDSDNVIKSQTVFTIPYKTKEMVGREALKMLDLGHRLMIDYLAKNPKHTELAQTIYAFLRLLTFEAIAQQQSHFDSDFLEMVEARAPAPLDDLTKVHVEQQIYGIIQRAELRQAPQVN